MDPIQMLMDEHRVIEHAMEALESYAARLTGGDAEPADLGRFVEFIRLYADGLHHRKEEDMLFATMVDNGFPRDGGPIAMMLLEHDEGRRLVGLMAGVAGLESPWSDESRQTAASAANGYTTLLRQHIFKEDNILYPMARLHLPAHAMEGLASLFAGFEDENQAERERLLEVAKSLVEAYAGGAPRVPPEPACHACGCGGVPVEP
jgi:hemerythrin-like domain-containing protein